MAHRRTKLSDQLRLAIEASGKSLNQIDRDTGIDKATLSRFVNGKGGLSIPVLDLLADYLKLNITMKGKPIRRKGK